MQNVPGNITYNLSVNQATGQVYGTATSHAGGGWTQAHLTLNDRAHAARLVGVSSSDGRRVVLLDARRIDKLEDWGAPVEDSRDRKQQAQAAASRAESRAHAARWRR